MPDISMCPGTACTKRNECYRYRATPSEYRQSFFTIAPMNSDGDCEYFWSIEGYTRLQPIKTEETT